MPVRERQGNTGRLHAKAAAILAALAFLPLESRAETTIAVPGSAPAATSEVGRAPLDPQGDRVVLLPTAQTHRRGTVFFSSYDVVILQAGYAFTDDTQVTVTALPLPSEALTLLDVSLKTSVWRGERVRAAAIGSVSGLAGDDLGALFVGRAGGVVQVCHRPSCESSFSLSSNVALVGPVALMANGVGGILRVGRRVSMLGELASLLPIGTMAGEYAGAMLAMGARLHYAHWGFDLTVLRALDSDAPLLPFLAATYRS
jgi:hypothetical protein